MNGIKCKGCDDITAGTAYFTTEQEIRVIPLVSTVEGEAVLRSSLTAREQEMGDPPLTTDSVSLYLISMIIAGILLILFIRQKWVNRGRIK